MKNIDEEKLYIYERDEWKCTVCGNGNQSVLTIAHRTGQGVNAKRVIENYLNGNSITGIKADEILQHPLNMCVACAGDCNSSVDMRFNRVAVDMLIYEIIEELKK